MLPACGLITGFSADSRLLVVEGYRPGDAFKGFRLWNLADGAVTTIPLDNYSFKGMDTWADVHGNEPYAVFGLTNGILDFWNLATISRVASWRVHEGQVKTAAFSPNGQLIATSGEKGDVKLWQVKTHREVRPFDPSGKQLAFLTFSPDGRLLAGSGGGENSGVWIWDVSSGRLRPALAMPDHDGIQALAFSPDSTLLATASFNNTAQLWDVRSRKLRATLKGHVQAVMGVAFSPDGKTLATVGDDRKVKLWNVATQQEMATMDLLRGGCRCVRFSPDGRFLAVSSFLDPEPYMWLWQVPSFEEIAAAEAKDKKMISQPVGGAAKHMRLLALKRGP
jgi:WD40 repeat protein